MTAYYNDNNQFCCGVLRRRIADGSLPWGLVDGRCIQDIDPAQLAHAGQIHLFAGIGGFALGARIAGLPDDFPVLTGGFPCQPFSVAGERLGVADDRYLWPEMFRIVRGVGSRPRGRYVVIENVPGIDGPSMALDRVLSDLETIGYTLAPPFEIPAAGVDRPVLRRRLWIVGRAHGNGPTKSDDIRQRNAGVARSGAPVGKSDVAGLAVRARGAGGELTTVAGSAWLSCTDGKYRRIPNAESGIQPMVDGVSQRMARLEAIGNALVPQIAAEIFRAIMESSDG